jgi:hypothetical protein
MYALIDYYSFTIVLKEPLGKGMFDSDKQFAISQFIALFEGEERRSFLSENWEAEKAKGFYAVRLRNTPTNISLSFGTINSHILVELAGQACANFDSQDLLIPLIERTHSRATRIDFAIDIKTAVSPADFIAARTGQSFKSSGNKYSPTGGTEYLGGRASERMARVYRYYEPHPRHEYLRVETEYKGSAAKASCLRVINTSVLQACLDAHKPFGWQHECWQTGDITSTRITYKSYRPDTASTLQWLYGDVVTALRKAIASGLIDLDEWLTYLREGAKDEN